MASNEMEPLAKFNANSNIIVSGQSHAGKTTFVFYLMKNLAVFESNIQHILYAYGMWQPLFEQMEMEIKNITFFHGVPDKKVLESFAKE